MSRPLHIPYFAIVLAFVAGCGSAPGEGMMEVETPSLTGIVRQVATEVLIQGVLVTADNRETRTTPNGTYTIDDLDVGEVMLTAEFPGFETYTRRVRIREGVNEHEIAMIPIDP